MKNASSQLMELVNINHEMDWSDFDDVVKFLEKDLDKVIGEVHGLDKLLIDDGKVSVNCPPDGGSLLLHTLSEKEGAGGITLKREFRVHNLGPDSDDAQLRKVEIREDVIMAPEIAGDPPVASENSTVVTM